MATITKDIADAESRVRARMEFQKELIAESNRLLRENPTVPFRLGDENSDAVKAEISKATGIPFVPEKIHEKKTEQKTKTEAVEETFAKTVPPEDVSEQKHAQSAHREGSAPSLRPAGQTILTEFEVIPDYEKVTIHEGTQQPRKMHAGPRMFNFGFSFTPAPTVTKNTKPKEK